MCQHVSSDRVELLIEVVSQRVNTFKTIGRRLGVTAIERGKQALDLGVELTAGISHRRIDAAIESSERGFVAQRLPFLDEAIDQCASGRASRSTSTLLASITLRMAADLSPLDGDWSFSMTIRRSASARSRERIFVRARLP